MTGTDAPGAGVRPARIGLRAFTIAALVVAVVLAVVVSGTASSEPDGLERVAIDTGFADAATDHALADLPTADYGIRGVENERLSVGLAGLLGVAVTFAVSGGLFLVLRRRPPTAQHA